MGITSTFRLLSHEKALMKSMSCINAARHLHEHAFFPSATASSNLARTDFEVIWSYVLSVASVGAIISDFINIVLWNRVTDCWMPTIASSATYIQNMQDALVLLLSLQLPVPHCPPNQQQWLVEATTQLARICLMLSARSHSVYRCGYKSLPHLVPAVELLLVADYSSACSRGYIYLRWKWSNST